LKFAAFNTKTCRFTIIASVISVGIPS
jgi:hypothetical protein